jgi:hypothetical protein
MLKKIILSKKSFLILLFMAKLIMKGLLLKNTFLDPPLTPAFFKKNTGFHIDGSFDLQEMTGWVVE